MPLAPPDLAARSTPARATNPFTGYRPAQNLSDLRRRGRGLSSQGLARRVSLMPVVQNGNGTGSPGSATDFQPLPTPSNNVTVETHSDINGLPIDLATALSMVGGQHPAVGFARWKLQEAYARYDAAQSLWLPSIRAGVSYNRHDGNLQASDGTIIDPNRSSLQAGLGAGAVGAGTTPRQGIVASFHAADAIFAPAIAEKRSWAREHAANATLNDQLYEVATEYIRLLTAVQDLRIIEESRQRTSELFRITKDFSEAGQGLQADADRMATELSLIESRLITAREKMDVSGARLSQALSLNAGQQIVPVDYGVTPIELVPIASNRASLISTGLRTRAELREAQALVAVACEEYNRQKFAHLAPSILLGFSQTGFGGGFGGTVNDVKNRMDFDAMVTWEVRNMGIGDRAARNATAARVEQARFEQVRMMDQVAREISESHSQSQHRLQRIGVGQNAIQTAQNSYDLNLARIRDGQGLPLEVLQSIQALENARREYLSAVTDYNIAQFSLQRALGWPVRAQRGTTQPAM